MLSLSFSDISFGNWHSKNKLSSINFYRQQLGKRKILSQRKKFKLRNLFLGVFKSPQQGFRYFSSIKQKRIEEKEKVIPFFGNFLARLLYKPPAASRATPMVLSRIPFKEASLKFTSLTKLSYILATYIKGRANLGSPSYWTSLVFLLFNLSCPELEV